MQRAVWREAAHAASGSVGGAILLSPILLPPPPGSLLPPPPDESSPAVAPSPSAVAVRLRPPFEKPWMLASSDERESVDAHAAAGGGAAADLS